MGRSIWVVAVVLALAGCKKSKPDPAAAAAVAKLEAFRIELCACPDDPCKLRVERARGAWVAAELGRSTFTADQRTAAETANRELDKCIAPLPTPAAEALRELKALTDEMCACADKACGEAVFPRIVSLGQRSKDAQPNDAQREEAAAIAERLTACTTRLGLAP